MTEIIKISTAGNNVLTTTDPAKLTFSSDYNTLKYFVSGNTTITINGNGSTQDSKVTVAHNLGYIPFFACFVNSGSGYFPVPRTEVTAAPNTTLYANAYADSTNLYLTLQINWSNGNNASVNYYYKIYKNNTGL